MLEKLLWVCQFSLGERVYALKIHIDSKMDGGRGETHIYSGKFIVDDEFNQSQLRLLQNWLDVQKRFAQVLYGRYHDMSGKLFTKKNFLNALY